MKGLDNINLGILILICLTIFSRTLLYITTDNHLLNLDMHLGLENDELLHTVFDGFAYVRAGLATIVLARRGIHRDILTYGLVYLILLSVIRMYYSHLKRMNPHSPSIHYIDRFQDVNAVISFLMAGYITMKIFASR